VRALEAVAPSASNNHTHSSTDIHTTCVRLTRG
jgi:hypothetical protein